MEAVCLFFAFSLVHSVLYLVEGVQARGFLCFLGKYYPSFFHDLNLAHKSGPSTQTLPLRKRNYSSATTTTPTKRNKMATMRRLSDPDVRSIFECLHNNKAPPPKLKFRIVAVGPTGLKLSPPSFEFEGKSHDVLSR